ncbi:hypothetical protein BJV82DRAFT_273621 [Fennellomyces sp. T-0311]|nr:hypothetical protein BJV82DRAFT_273621 [Fennellomyces sp. T-0311]
MNKRLSIVLLLLLHYVLADEDRCSWPCPNDSDICQLDYAGVESCQPLQDAQWIIPFPESQAVFYVKDQSNLGKLYESCELAPKSKNGGASTCAPGLLCIEGECRSSHQYLERRENGNTFATNNHHTTAFNVIHVIAAVVGILGAAFVGVTVFIMCRRRRRRQQQLQEQKQLHHTSTTSTTSSTSSSPPQPPKSMHRFNQFAQAYCHDEVAAPPHAHQPKNGYTDEDPLIINSPSMQQVHLHTQLLYQAGVQRSNSQPSSSALFSPPPPPYQP